MERNLSEFVEEVKKVENGVTEMMIPILKDSILDYKVIYKKMFAIIILLIMISSGVIGYLSYLLYKANNKYAEFVNQFEFESEYIQQVDTSDSSSATINDGIKVNK